MRNDELLAELIQNAVSDYVLECDEMDFTAVVTVSTCDGWTSTPEIRAYDNAGAENPYYPARQAENEKGGDK